MSWFNHPFLLRLSVLWGSQTTPDCILYWIPRWLAQCLAHCRWSVNICWKNEWVYLGPNTMPEHTIWFRNIKRKTGTIPNSQIILLSSVPPFLLLGHILILSIPSKSICAWMRTYTHTQLSVCIIQNTYSLLFRDICPKRYSCHKNSLSPFLRLLNN